MVEVHLNAVTPFAIIIIAIVALLIFGPKKLPELGRAVGTTLREFKKGTKGLIDDEDEPKKPVIEHKDTTIQQAEVKEQNNEEKAK
ncbi:twin-arginine translocase TatA/TatE family subunit [Ureibacillus manganicus]|uniref:Sec-independent protein translocase protein TatA n=1 Tax=Ureibacillus manganicus DSM 26584 TaxID=1384049 RepID=A0A0A3IPX3_9BACL|nr:twin-arginine translocase TatA/TatE family subunit [Ureibacillus manganicus]KGR76887.1 translocase [Ureibacillus manganicus DSM 26584]